MDGVKIGKISRASFGLGGYQGAMLGLHVTLESSGWGTSDTRSAWDATQIKHSEHCKWTEASRDAQYAEIMRYVSSLLAAAKVDRVDQLVGIPIAATFEGNLLKEWRVLTEAL